MSDTQKERRDQSSPPVKENFRAKEAAEYLCIGQSTIWNFVKQGKLHPIRISDRVTIFTKADLDSLIEEGKKNV